MAQFEESFAEGNKQTCIEFWLIRPFIYIGGRNGANQMDELIARSGKKIIMVKIHHHLKHLKQNDS